MAQSDRVNREVFRFCSECITDSTRTPSIVENIVGVNHLPGTGKINLTQQELITFLSRQKS